MNRRIREKKMVQSIREKVLELDESLTKKQVRHMTFCQLANTLTALVLEEDK